jgi:hypothetical protein
VATAASARTADATKDRDVGRSGGRTGDASSKSIVAVLSAASTAQDLYPAREPDKRMEADYE